MCFELRIRSIAIVVAFSTVNQSRIALASFSDPMPVGSTAHWIENRGQWPAQVEYLAQVPGGVVWIEAEAIAFCSQPEVGEEGMLLRLAFEGARKDARWAGSALQVGRYNYFHGNDASRWVRNARSFGELRCEDLYSGVDLVLRFQGRSFKYDLLAEPGAAIDAFAMRVEGTEEVDVEPDGTVRIGSEVHAVHQRPGASWQVLDDGRKRDVQPRWVKEGPLLRIELEGYDPALPLVIDPELSWATYLGGAIGVAQGDVPATVALGPDGDAYVVGKAAGYDFPQVPGSYRRAGDPFENFVARFRGSDGALIYSNAFGASDANEMAHDVAVDALGRATVVGSTNGDDFPTTPGALDQDSFQGPSAGYVSQFTPAGDDFVFSTYLSGQSGGTIAFGVDVTEQGDVIVVGTGSSDFPTTPGAFENRYGGQLDGFVCSLDEKGSRLQWSTFLGGSRRDEAHKVEIDRDGTIVVAGLTASMDFPTTPGVVVEHKLLDSFTSFVTRMAGDGSALVWSTHLAGNTGPETTTVRDVGLDAFETAFVVGTTTSSDFPTTPGVLMEDPPWPSGGGTFVSRLSPGASAFLYSTFLGGSTSGGARYCSVDASGLCTVTGIAVPGIPTTPGSIDPSGGGLTDLLVARFAPGGDRLFYSTFLGGPNHEVGTGIAATSEGRVTVVGQADWPGGFPTTPGTPFPEFQGGQSDAVIATLDLVLEGVREYGVSTPACLGPIRIGVTEMPVAGASQFGLYASGAPPSTTGFLLLCEGAARMETNAPDQPLYMLDLSRLILRLPATTDAYGYAECAYPLAADSTGRVIHAQFVFDATPDCPNPTKRCSSFALELSVQ